MARFGSLVFGAILGGIIGAGIGILLAPKSGVAMRSQLVNYKENLRNEVRRAADQRRIELEAELTRLREPASPNM